MVSFRSRTRPLDWAAVGAAREVDAVAQSPATAAVQDIQCLLNNVAFGDARDPPNPELLQKAFGFAQLTIEYLLHVQETVTKSLEAAQAELATERLALDAARAKLCRRQGQGRELRDCQTTLAAASTMLAQFGVDVAPLLQRASAHGGKQSSQMQVWVPAFLDPYSGKSFKSAEYLKRHMYGHHGDEVRSDLERYGEPSKVPSSSSFKRETKEEMPQAPVPAADSSSSTVALPTAVPLPLDDVEALAQRVVVELTGGGAHGRVTRRALLKEMQSWRKVQSAGSSSAAQQHGSISAFLPPITSLGQGQATTVHDLLESAAVDPYHRSNSSVMLDWRGVDAHLRTLREVDAFLRTDLQKVMADQLAATAQEVSLNFEMKQTKDVDARAKELFRELDTDHSGAITIAELLAAVGDPIEGRGVRSSLGFRDAPHPGATASVSSGGGASVGAEDEAHMLATIKSKMGELDHDGDGLISLAELKSFLERVSFFNHGFALGKDLGFGIGHASGAQVAKNELAAAVDQAKQQAQREAREAAAAHYVATTTAANAEASAAEASLVRAASGGNEDNEDDEDEAEVTMAVSCFEAIQLFMHLDAGVGKGVVLLSDLVREACQSRDAHTRNTFGLETITDLASYSSEEEASAALERVECAEAALMAFGSRSAKMKNPHGNTSSQKYEDEDEEVSLEALGACTERLKAFSLGYRHGAYDQARLLLDSASNDAGADDIDPAANEVNAEVVNSEEEEEEEEGGENESIRSSAELVPQSAHSAASSPPYLASKDFWVELSVLSAQGLRDDADSNGLADPLYVVRHLASGIEITRSKAVHKTLNPRFPPGNTVTIPMNPPGSNRLGTSTAAAAAAAAAVPTGNGNGHPNNNGNGPEEEDDEDAPLIVVELWDQDGVIFKKSTDFLGCVALTRRDLLDPRHLGAGPRTFPLTAALAGQPSSNNSSSDGVNRNAGGEGAPEVVGVLELAWNAFAAVRVELLGADGLVEVRRKDLFGSYGSPAAPQARLTLRCEGCDVMKPLTHDRAKAAASTAASTAAVESSSGGGGGGKAGAGVYETDTAPAGSSPRWASSHATVVVPLGSQGWRGGVIEAKDVLSGQSLGQCALAPQDLLHSTPLEGKVHVLKSAPSSPQGENEEDGHSSSGGDPDALRISGSTVSIRILAPAGIASFHEICLKRALDAAAAPAPWLACMEVELQVLRCEGLVKPAEPFVVVLLDGIAVGPTPPSNGNGGGSCSARRSKARPTTRAPEWGPDDDATFVVSIPFPRALAALASLSDNGQGNERVLAAAAATEPPSTMVTVQVWDANKLTKHELLGAVTLPWATLIHRSLGTYPLTDHTPALSTNTSSLRLLSKGARSSSVSFDLASPAGKNSTKNASISDINSGGSSKKKAYAAAQGAVTVKIQPMQMFDVLLVGCRGVAVADGCGTSDPYAEVALVQGGLAGDATTLAAFEHLSAHSMRTAVQKRTLRPQFGHHFVFSRALSAPGLASDKGERMRRKNLLLTVDEPASSSSLLDVNAHRLAQRYPGVWAETTGGGANRHCSAAHTTLAPFAVHSGRLGSSANFNNNSTHHQHQGSSGGRREVLGGLSMKVSVWDRDELSSNDFLGSCELSEELLREPRAGVLSLPLHVANSGSKNNKRAHAHDHSSSQATAGWVEVLVRASVPPEVVESPRFLRRFPPPTPARLPLVCVRLSNLRCEHLNSADSNGKSDPYATFTARGALDGSNCSTSGSHGKSSGSSHHHSVVNAVRGSVPTNAVREVLALGTTETLSQSLSPQWTSAFEVMLLLDDHTGGEGAHALEENHDRSSISTERSASEEGEGSGSGSRNEWNNAANSHVEVTVFDKDKFSGDDYLGSCVLNFDDLVCHPSRWQQQQQQQQFAVCGRQDTASRELSKELGSGTSASLSSSNNRGAPKAEKHSSSSGSAFDCFSCKSSDVLLPPPEAGHFIVTSSPAACLEFTILGASGLAAANLDGQSDPYAKVKCSAALLGAAAATSLTKEGYLKEPAGWSGQRRGKAFKTAVRSSTLAPQWGDALSVCVELAAILGDSSPSSSLLDSSGHGSGEGELANTASRQGSGNAFCGITIEVWDAPSVAGHTFLGEVQLSRQQLLEFLIQPTAAPHVFPLADNPSHVASSTHFKKPAKGVVEVHVVASALPPGWNECFTSGRTQLVPMNARTNNGLLVETPTRRLSAAPCINTQQQPQLSVANEDEIATVPFLVEEAARVEMLIRETARQNIEARHLARGTTGSHPNAEANAN